MAKKLNYDPNEKCTQAIVFARVSSKKQKDKGVSLDVQMETITQYCIDNGLKIVKDLSIDESSTKGERKQYHEMLDFAKSCAGKVAIIVNYVDRLQRSYDDTYELNKLRKEGKIEIHFLKEDLIITKDSAAMDLYEPIISKALFDKVQEVFQSKSRDVFSHQQEYKAIQFAFRGLIKCDTCGCAITPEHKIKKNGKRYVYLKCSHLRGNCKQGLVNENILFAQLDSELFSKIQIPNRVLEALKKNVLNNLEEETVMNANLKRNLQTELQILINKEDNLTDLYVSGKIKEAIYNRQINAIADEKTRLEESIAKYKEITKDIKATVDNLLDIAGMLVVSGKSKYFTILSLVTIS